MGGGIGQAFGRTVHTAFLKHTKEGEEKKKHNIIDAFYPSMRIICLQCCVPAAQHTHILLVNALTGQNTRP